MHAKYCHFCCSLIDNGTARLGMKTLISRGLAREGGSEIFKTSTQEEWVNLKKYKLGCQLYNNRSRESPLIHTMTHNPEPHSGLWAEVARWRSCQVLRYFENCETDTAIMGSRLGGGNLSFFESYVLETKLTASLWRLQSEMASKEWFGSHYN